MATVRSRGNIVLTSETLRNSADSNGAQSSKAEERISLFWRICGGTVLSIAALVVVTLYQQINNNMTELRNDMIRLNESRGDLIKKDEFNMRMTSVWNSIKEEQATGGALIGLRERSTLLEQQLRTAESERKDLSRELQQLRERLAVIEGRQHSSRENSASATH